jgi:hypothetical protein
MKILYTSVLFLMGLFSSNEWFPFGYEISSPASREEKHDCQPAALPPRLVLIVEETCPMTVSRTKSYNLFVKAHEVEIHPITYKILWLVITGKTQIELSEKMTNTILISIHSTGRPETHHRIGLPGKILIQLEE